MRLQTSLLFLVILITSIESLTAQTLPVGTPFLEELARRRQVKGEGDSVVSFMIRPLYAIADNYDSLYHPGGFTRGNKQSQLLYKGKEIRFGLLPAGIDQQYNTHHPFGWNDGAMIPAKGYQARVTGGIYGRLGPLSIQLQPELIYAQNSDFKTFPVSYPDSVWSYYYRLLNDIDMPEKFGDGNYTKLLPGQSHIKLRYKKLAIGYSTENLWWGPGIRNSLLMSNNAPGFGHISFQSTAPVQSPIGSFEWQLIGGTLKGSGILPPDTGRIYNGQRLYQPKPSDKRYINGMIATWQPKWLKGLYLGFSRVVYLYKEDQPSSLEGYLPVLSTLFKGKTTGEDAKRKDQMLSIFFRLLLPKEKTELYAEFGRNDHAQNPRDLLLEPEHSAAYLIGGRKVFATKKADLDFEIAFEATSLQLSSTNIVRETPGWYSHYQVKHGYTNRGQVLGAGIGPGSNSQTLMLNWLKGLNKTGIVFERVLRNNDFYYPAIGQPGRNYKGHWVDIAIGLQKTWYCKRILYVAGLNYIRTLNYHWYYSTEPVLQPETSRDVNNIQASISMRYLF